MLHSETRVLLGLRLILVPLALGLVSPAGLRAFEWDGAQLAPVSVDGRVGPRILLGAADLNGDGSIEQLALDEGRASIRSTGSTLWMSPAAWTVTQALLADLNHDGSLEVVMIAWRPFASWPIDAWLPHGGRTNGFHDQAGQSCHLILVGWRDGQWRQVWAGSALADPLIQIDLADLDGDGHEELLALEGRYARHGSEAHGSIGVWRWNGFGFTLVSRAAGRYSQFEPVTTVDGRILILAQETWR
jgi:hypothetical protein